MFLRSPLTLFFAALFGFVFAAPAEAGSCDTYLRRAETAKGTTLLAAYDRLASCDANMARENFPRFMMRSGDVETLVPLTLKAIDLGAFKQVGKMMEKVPYENQVDVARDVGSACETQPSVVTFLHESAKELRGTSFTRWAPAHEACSASAHQTWLATQVASPPSSPYSDRYDAVVRALSKHQGAAALPVLEKATIQAAKGGPFANLLDHIARAVEPSSYGAEIPEADREAMRETYLRIAKNIAPEQARQVADKLYTLGEEATAAGLIPSIFPASVQGDGTILWGSAAIETCDSKAIVHWATFTRPPEVWATPDLVADAIRAAKPKLKCDSGDWKVVTSDEPLANRTQVQAWAEVQATVLVGSGADIKFKEEKGLSL
ncbi:MAG: hypothetical protein ACON5B_07725 [Myxococcota bacterium]